MWQTCPLLASALVMAAGAFSINCGMAGPDVQLPVPQVFQRTWFNVPIVLRESGSVRCAIVEFCQSGQCRRRCSVFTPDAQNPATIDEASFHNCDFRQELSDSGDSLILSCENCGPSGESQEIFRVDSGEELDASETLIVDRNEPDKSFERLSENEYFSCKDYLDSQALSPADP